MTQINNLDIDSKEVNLINAGILALIKSTDKLSGSLKNTATLGKTMSGVFAKATAETKAFCNAITSLESGISKVNQTLTNTGTNISGNNSATALLSEGYKQTQASSVILDQGLDGVNQNLTALGLSMNLDSVATNLLSGNFKQAFADSGMLQLGLGKVNEVLGATGLSMNVNSVASSLLSGEYKKAFTDSGLLESALGLLSSQTEALGLGFDANSMASFLMQGNFMDAMVQSGLLDNTVANLAEQLGIGGGEIQGVNDLLGWFIENVINAVAESEAFGVVMQAISGVMEIVGAIIGFVAENFDIFAPIILAVVAAIGAYNAIMAICNIVNAPVNLTVLAIVAAVGALIAIVALVIKHWEPIKDFFKNLWDGICNAFKVAINFVIGGLNSFIGFINTLISGALNGINGLIKAANKIPFINIPLIPVDKLQIPKIPLLANGGIVSSATMAIVGEGKHSEAVVPLGASPEFASMKADIANAVVQAILLTNRSLDQKKNVSGSDGETIVLNLDGQTFAKLILPKLKKESQRYGYNMSLKEV